MLEMSKTPVNENAYIHKDKNLGTCLARSGKKLKLVFYNMWICGHV